jgi:hypothetical protein
MLKGHSPILATPGTRGAVLLGFGLERSGLGHTLGTYSLN